MNDRGSPTYVFLLTLVAALGGLLFGYDTAVISGAIGFLQEHFQLDPQYMTGWAAACALIGCALGAGMAGLLSDRFGRRGMLIVSALLFLISAVGTAFPQTIAQFIFFRIIGGLGIGAASMTSPMYIAEIAPAKIRGRMVSVNQFAIVSGMLAVYFVNFFIAEYGKYEDLRAIAAHGPGLVAWNVDYGWRWMFGSGILPSVLFLFLLFFVPESPRWLIAKNRESEALAILTRVGGAQHAGAEVAEIRATIARETGSIRQLFEPGMRMVLVIGVVLAILQQVVGINVFLYFAPKIFEKLGSETNAALLAQAILGAVNMFFTIVAIWTVDRLGRKPLMLIGALGMGICLVSMGFVVYGNLNAHLALGFILGYIACFALSVGPVVWVVLSEIFPTSIRGRAMAIATVCLWIANYFVTQTFTMMNDSPYLVKKFNYAFPFWIYAAFCAVMLWFVWRFVPETKGKSLEEIERGWLKG
ncbi:MAG: sugar porter family MFS transporter [Pirellulales bacterium]|nr:sugar porter family MFS transporter [Pirellulales bacterium]